MVIWFIVHYPSRCFNNKKWSAKTHEFHLDMFLIAFIEDDSVNVASDLDEVSTSGKGHRLNAQKAARPFPDGRSYLPTNLENIKLYIPENNLFVT
jgi:hypothetical protein